MTYWLGIDLGTTCTAAALCRPAAGELETEVFPLGGRSPAVPSVLFLAGDGSLVVGEAAERRALTDPDRVVREFKRRVGDEIPLLVGGEPYSAHEFAAMLAHWVWRRVAEREGEPPRGVALTCPASWGPYKMGLFEQAVRGTGAGRTARLDGMMLLSEPQAAAVSYASRARVDVGARLAVYDLGGGTFDAAVLCKDSPTTFTVLGRPEGIDGLGGVTFDETLFEHVCAAAGVPLAEIDPGDPDVIPDAARLRRECTEAKEALSVDTDTTVPVVLGGVRRRVRVTRAEFEEMIRPELDKTIEVLHRALASAGTDGTRADAILLVGGSSRIPLVSQLIAAEFGQAPAIDADPKTAVAMGAARFAAPPGVPAAADTVTDMPLAAVPPQRPEISTMLASGDHEAGEPARHRRRRLGVAALVLLLLAGVVTALRPPALTDLLTHARHSPGATSGTGTPAPSQKAGLDGAGPRGSATPAVGSTAGPAPSAAASSPARSAGKPAGTGAARAAAPARATAGSTANPPARATSPSPAPPATVAPASSPPQSPAPTPTPSQTSPTAAATQGTAP